MRSGEAPAGERNEDEHSRWDCQGLYDVATDQHSQEK